MGATLLFHLLLVKANLPKRGIIDVLTLSPLAHMLRSDSCFDRLSWEKERKTSLFQPMLDERSILLIVSPYAHLLAWQGAHPQIGQTLCSGH